MSVRGVVLAGGRSKRFGTDKALAKINNVTLLEKAVGLLEALKLDPVVVTHESADYTFFGRPVLRDLIPNKGPLAGLYTAMTTFPGTALLVLTCDMPYLTRPVLRGLLEFHKKENLATIYRLDVDRLQPFPGLYESSLCPLILEKIKADQLSMHGFLERIPQRQMIPSSWRSDVFGNVNERGHTSSYFFSSSLKT